MRTRSAGRRIQIISAWAALMLAMLSCSQGYVSPAEITATAIEQASHATPSNTPQPSATLTALSSEIQATAAPAEPLIPTFTDMPKKSRTPKPTHTVDPNATPKPPIQYYTQAGDTLPSIIGRYGVTREQIVSNVAVPETGLINPGTLLIIPDVLEDVFASIEVLPDSEVVYSPSAAGFDVQSFVENAGGYLSRYTEVIGPKRYSGAELIQKVSQENSVNPYLLLALLEYKGHWVYGNPSNIAEKEYPMGMIRLEYKGLFKQLSWTVQQLNIGYYGWRAGILSTLPFKDGSEKRISPGLNAGTAAIQYLFAQWYDPLEWAGALYGNDNMPDLMTRMFGDFWQRSRNVEPLYPADLQQPEFQLPFMPGRVWNFTGGPHSEWGMDGALSALDFAPPAAESGCTTSYEWVTAVAPGIIARAGDGMVILDLDGDGIEQTGWDIMYLHIATSERVKVGAILKAGDKIGHPSCEGGLATGTHVHIVRKFNGEWILADGPLPFMMSGYVAKKGAEPYAGKLVKGDKKVIADPFSSPKSEIELP